MWKLFFIGLVFLLSDANAATTIDGGSFDTIWEVFKMWISGSLGLTITLLGLLGSTIAYMMSKALTMSQIGTYSVTTATPHFLISAYLFSFFAGAVVGIVQMMANLGRGTFN